MKMTIKTGDSVVVITGKDKGKSGKVLAVYAESGRVLVENVNVVSKHQKPKSQQDKGGIITKPAPIDASNVMVVCPVCGKPSRVGHMVIDGKKVRICKKCKGALDRENAKVAKKENKKAVKAEDLKGAKLKAVKEEPKAKAAKTTKATKTAKTEEKVEKAPAKKTTKTTAKTETKAKEPAKTTKSTATKTTKKSTTAKKAEK